jgi:hypothetical protein
LREHAIRSDRERSIRCDTDGWNKPKIIIIIIIIITVNNRTTMIIISGTQGHSANCIYLEETNVALNFHNVSCNAIFLFNY